MNEFSNDAFGVQWNLPYQRSLIHTNIQCWASYFVKVTSYILLATEQFSYSYILPIK